MKRNSLILTLTFTLTACAISTTAPMVTHTLHGEVSADSPVFKKEAQQCARLARKKITANRQNRAMAAEQEPEVEIALAAKELYSFFSGNASCIKSKGWQIKR